MGVLTYKILDSILSVNSTDQPRKFSWPPFYYREQKNKEKKDVVASSDMMFETSSIKICHLVKTFEGRQTRRPTTSLFFLKKQACKLEHFRLS